MSWNTCPLLAGNPIRESGAFDELWPDVDRGEIQLDGKDGFV
ncbi:hypothetical protein [Glutamicibacter sp. PS]|nr:hypothetical protein [Glutamicibacter sp. PS]